ncbi:cell division protein FtsZ [Campylobacter sp. JMF_01 NE2]|uniref:cell division protein FtsZ n=1 Tax=unclassified Campylobacter TaxID=2593542 RepID=UPI0022EA0597|nr:MULTISPECIES: cell division protein FtsZ [unclassified Campylobacter]MDA3053149.1 cell division protein FtsZ [Campylobacter sp. JMF_03 NE3]MDA3067480.1 cell division protein FtsZ [Campylobacter sp. JMF_01 NE2]
MKGFIVEENKGVYGAKMKVIGVGGGGCNMINHMIREGFTKADVELMVANTDVQALEKSIAKTRIQLGPNLTRGLGCGMDPAMGRGAAEESYEDLKDRLDYADMVFVGSGFGGGTGTGAAPIVAKAAKEKKALTIGIVTTPFDFEGKKRMRLAQEGLEELKKECDSVIVIPNQNLLKIIDKKTGIKEAYKKVDNVLAQAVNGMISVILESGDSDMNVDYADVRKVMQHRGMALMGTGVCDGEDAAEEAIKAAIQSPLLDNVSINGAQGVLVHFKISPDCSLIEIECAMNIIREAVSEDADIIFGTTTDDSIENNRVEVTLIATGFEKSAAEKKQVTKQSVADSRQAILERCARSSFFAKQKVASGDFNGDETYDELEEPTFLRKQMD